MKREEGVKVDGRLKAWGAATLAAGPVFITAQLMKLSGLFPGWILLPVIAVPLGFLIGAVPLAISINAGAALGGRWPVLRHPLIWAFFGVLGGAALGPVIARLVPSSATAALFAGGVSGLIARHFLRWIDPVARPAEHPYSRVA